VVAVQANRYHLSRQRHHATTPDRLKRIADMFSLDEWESRTDLHFMMGDSTDHLFDD